MEIPLNKLTDYLHHFFCYAKNIEISELFPCTESRIRI